MNYKNKKTYHHQTTRYMSEHPARGHFVPYFGIPGKTSCPGYGLGHPGQEFHIRGLKNSMGSGHKIPCHHYPRGLCFSRR